MGDSPWGRKGSDTTEPLTLSVFPTLQVLGSPRMPPPVSTSENETIQEMEAPSASPTASPHLPSSGHIFYVQEVLGSLLLPNAHRPTDHLRG